MLFFSRKPYIAPLTLKEKDFFLNAVNEDILNKHIASDFNNSYLRIVDGFCSQQKFYVLLDGVNKAQVLIYVLKKHRKPIGCSMVYLFDDYVEFMYMHIAQESRKKGFGFQFQSQLESLVEAKTKMKIRCLSQSIEGAKLAEKMNYKLTSISEKGTKTFEKIKL